jgi:hypothetical protein
MKKRGRPPGKVKPITFGEPEDGIPVPPPRERGHPVLGKRRHPDRDAELAAIVAAHKGTNTLLASKLCIERRGYFATSHSALVRLIGRLKMRFN